VLEVSGKIYKYNLLSFHILYSYSSVLFPLLLNCIKMGVKLHKKNCNDHSCYIKYGLKSEQNITTIMSAK